MTRDEEIRAAIVDKLHALGLQANQPVSLYAIGTALVPAFTEHEITDGVLSLHDRRIIEIVTGNRIQLR